MDSEQTGSRIQFCFRWESIQTFCLYFKRVKHDKPDITLISFTFWLNMVPASGRNLSGGWNHAGSFSYDLISSGILLEHDFFKIHFIGWSPTGHGHRTIVQRRPPPSSTQDKLTLLWGEAQLCLPYVCLNTYSHPKITYSRANVTFSGPKVT